MVHESRPEDGKDTMTPLAELPHWAKPRTIMHMAERMSRPVPLGLTAGQAIPQAFVSTVLLWTFFVCFLPLTAYTAECQSDSFATYPAWLWLAFAPVLASALCIEWSCFRLVIVPKYQVLKRSSVFGFTVHFYVWLVYAVLKSAVSYFHFATLSAFTGTMRKTWQCPVGDRLEELWRALSKDSPVDYVLTFSPSFVDLATLLWGLNLVLLIHALADAVPIHPSSPLAVHYELGSLKHLNYTTEYFTLYSRWRKQNHGAALMALAQANGMHMVFFQDMHFAFHKAEAYFKEGNHQKAIMHVQAQVVRGITAGLSGTCVGALQLELKVQSYVLLRRISGDSCYRLFAFAAVSGVQNMLTIYTCWCYVRGAWQWKDRLQGAVAAGRPEKDYEASKLRRDMRRLKAGFALVVALTVVFTGLVLYSGLKLALTFLHCSGGAWTLSGCVDLRANAH